MARTKMSGAVAVFALVAAVAGAAPGRTPAREGGSRLRPDLYAGYSFTHAGDANLHGWVVAGAYPLRGLSVVADASGHYGAFAGADLAQLGLFLGARQTWRIAGVSPFAEALVGGVRTTTQVALPGGSSLDDSSVAWGVAIGGGASYRVAPRWSARGLVHLRLLRGGGVWDKDPRLSIGVAYRLGR